MNRKKAAYIHAAVVGFVSLFSNGCFTWMYCPLFRAHLQDDIRRAENSKKVWEIPWLMNPLNSTFILFLKQTNKIPLCHISNWFWPCNVKNYFVLISQPFTFCLFLCSKTDFQEVVSRDIKETRILYFCVNKPFPFCLINCIEFFFRKTED
jgi:hypothetical protein